MAKVKTYTATPIRQMKENPAGEWVTLKDYQWIEKQLKILAKDYRDLHKRVLVQTRKDIAKRQQLSYLCTTDHESKESFIERTRAVLDSDTPEESK